MSDIVERLRTIASAAAEVGEQFRPHRDNFPTLLISAADEIEALREIISKCAGAIGNGAGCAPNASIGFMQSIPDEIALAMSRLRLSQYTYIGKDGKPITARELEDERDTLRTRLAEAEKVIEPFAESAPEATYEFPDHAASGLSFTCGELRAARAWKEASNG